MKRSVLKLGLLLVAVLFVTMMLSLYIASALFVVGECTDGIFAPRTCDPSGVYPSEVAWLVAFVGLWILLTTAPMLWAISNHGGPRMSATEISTRVLVAGCLAVTGVPMSLITASVAVDAERDWTARHCYQRLSDADVGIPEICSVWVEHCRPDCDFATYWPPLAAEWIARNKERKERALCRSGRRSSVARPMSTFLSTPVMPLPCRPTLV